ncbi:hypothetical protein Q0601_10380 [Paracoccus onubensis]|uniref:hypothetical protein n=1 Tax=Paracoccus onubensis TaxID=1675788 RepID=UPI002730DC11|nr:hypothetical protein [Paracoccus onubensis]MDP0927579.1 hypothetical protein [Paracoccus onubensis]
MPGYYKFYALKESDVTFYGGDFESFNSVSVSAYDWVEVKVSDGDQGDVYDLGFSYSQQDAHGNYLGPDYDQALLNDIPGHYSGENISMVRARAIADGNIYRFTIGGERYITFGSGVTDAPVSGTFYEISEYKGGGHTSRHGGIPLREETPSNASPLAR